MGCQHTVHYLHWPKAGSFWNRTLKTFIAHSGRRPYVEDSWVTVKAALQSSLKYKTEKERRLPTNRRSGPFRFPLLYLHFQLSGGEKKKLIYKKQQQPNAQLKGVSWAWWGKEVINSSVLKSKKRKIKIGDIYMCDKKRKGGGGWGWTVQQSESSRAGVDSPATLTLFHCRVKSDSSECKGSARANPAGRLTAFQGHRGQTKYGKRQSKLLLPRWNQRVRRQHGCSRPRMTEYQPY